MWKCALLLSVISFTACIARSDPNEIMLTSQGGIPPASKQVIMKIGEFRLRHPEYNDMNDIDLTKGLHEKFYSELAFQDFADKFSRPVTSTLTQGQTSVRIPEGFVLDTDVNETSQPKTLSSHDSNEVSVKGYIKSIDQLEAILELGRRNSTLPPSASDLQWSVWAYGAYGIEPPKSREERMMENKTMLAVSPLSFIDSLQVQINVSDLPDIQQTTLVNALRNNCELKLRQTGIGIEGDMAPVSLLIACTMLSVRETSGVVRGYSGGVALEVSSECEVVHNGTRQFLPIYEHSRIFIATSASVNDNVRQIADDLVTKFLNEYLKANSKETIEMLERWNEDL